MEKLDLSFNKLEVKSNKLAPVENPEILKMRES